MRNIAPDSGHPVFLSVSEAARYLGVARKIIYQLLEQNELDAFRQKGKIFIDVCSIQKFRNSGKMV